MSSSPYQAPETDPSGTPRSMSIPWLHVVIHILLLVTSGVFLGRIVPSFFDMFSEFELELPFMTRLVRGAVYLFGAPVITAVVVCGMQLLGLALCLTFFAQNDTRVRVISWVLIGVICAAYAVIASGIFPLLYTIATELASI